MSKFSGTARIDTAGRSSKLRIGSPRSNGPVFTVTNAPIGMLMEWAIAYPLGPSLESAIASNVMALEV